MARNYLFRMGCQSIYIKTLLKRTFALTGLSFDVLIPGISWSIVCPYLIFENQT